MSNGIRVCFAFLLLCAIAPAKGRWQTFTATAYAQEGITASGKHTAEGRVAADPSVLPIGTTIQVRGAGPYSGSYTVRDTGQKVNGRQIDIFIDSTAEAKRFGKKTVRVRILKRAPK